MDSNQTRVLDNVLSIYGEVLQEVKKIEAFNSISPHNDDKQNVFAMAALELSMYLASTKK